MKLDADEWLDDDLRQAIREQLVLAGPEVGGFTVDRRDFFLGRAIRFGGRGRMSFLRIWRHGAAVIENRWMDEHAILTRGIVKPLSGLLLHRNDKPFSEWIEKHNKYADAELLDIAIEKYQLNTRINRIPNNKKSMARTIYYKIGGGIAPIMLFLYRYIIRGGFLDGGGGYYYHFFQGYWYRTLVAAKLSELEAQLKNCVTDEQRIAVIRAQTGRNI